MLRLPKDIILFESFYLSTCIEAFLFGIYSALFATHLKCHAIKREADDAKPNIIFYALCLLYLLTMALFATEIATTFVDFIVEYRLNVTTGVLFGCCDFIAQSILIHRCWTVWRHDVRVVIVPSFLAFAFLVMWMTSIGSVYIGQMVIFDSVWGVILGLSGLIVSMIVNALVTGLIVFKIFKVFRHVKRGTTSNEKSLGISRGDKFRSIIFIIVESGMTLFAIQVARVAVSATLLLTNVKFDAFRFIVPIHEMLNGIAPTVIFVRMSLGLSFRDKESLFEAVGTLRFAADDSNSIAGTESIDHDGTLRIGHDDPNPLPEMVNIMERGETTRVAEVTMSR